MNIKHLKELINLYLLGNGTLRNPLFLKYQPFILPVISLVFCVILLGLVTVPQTLSLMSAFKTLSELNNQQTELDNKISQLQRINEEEYKTDLETALIALPPEKDVPGAVDQILIILSGSGLHLDGVAFDNSSDATVQTENYAVRLSVTGAMDQLKAFIDKTKNSPRIIKINSIETSTGPDQILGATISLLVFYHPLPTNVATDNPTVPLLTDSDISLLEKIKENASTIPTLSQLDATNIPTGKSDPFQ